MKTSIVLAAHGAPATDCPRRMVGIFMALESMPRLVARFTFLQRLRASYEHRLRIWPRSADNDPYKTGVEALADRIAAHTGREVISGYLEFCTPDIGACIDTAVSRGAERVIVASTMTTRGGEHSEIEIRDIVTAGSTRHPYARIIYAWPFDTDRVAGLFADEIARLTVGLE